MSLASFSIKNSVFAWMLMAALILFGWLSFRTLGISEMPDVDFPVINIQATYEGAAPEVMETQVADLIEESVMSVEGITSVTSTSKQEEASIVVEFGINRDIDQALMDVQAKVNQALKKLPEDMDPPIISKTNPEDQPIMWIAFAGSREPRKIMEYARDHIRDRLQTVAGVGEITLSGYVAPSLRIWPDIKKMNELEITVTDILNTISTENIDLPAGRIENDAKEITLRVLGEPRTAQDFSNLPILRRGGTSIHKTLVLGDLARVEEGLDDIRRISRSGSEPAVGLGIRKMRGSNAVKLSDGLRKKIDEIAKTLPPDLKIWVNFDSTNFVRKSITDMQHDLWIAVILTALVCFAFLRSIGPSFNILLAIPTSIVGTFMIVKMLGYTLNTFTFLALILSIGIVVDDAIMVLENIMKHRERGKSPMLAAKDGAEEITPAAIATTLSIGAIFLPVIFVTGIMGKYFTQFGLVLTGAVFLSLLEAVTLTPMRVSKLNVALKQDTHWFDRFENIYSNALEWCLNHRLKTVFTGVAIFVGSLFLVPHIQKEFIPAQDQGIYLIRVKTPIGSSLNFTDEKMKKAEAIVGARPEVNRYFSAVGGFGGGDVNTGMIFVTMKDHDKRPKLDGKRITQQKSITLMRKELSQIEGLQVFVQDLASRGFTARRSFPVEFALIGPDWGKLTDLTKKFLQDMKASPYFLDVDTDYLEGQPELTITPNREALASHHVSLDGVVKTIQATMGGVKAGTISRNGRKNDIRVRLPEDARQQPADLDRLLVRNQEGQLIPLSRLVVMKEAETLKSITRRDRERAISIFSNVGEGYSQDEALKKIDRMTKNMPEGYRTVLGGSAEVFRDSFQDLGFVLLIGLLVAYMILASQYDSFVKPLIVLMALPFSLTGAWLALKITDKSLNMYSYMGLILLMGIVKKNSIILVDFFAQAKKNGMLNRQALMEVCPKRLRPIVMTSAATIAAALPPALGLGVGSETRQPMAIVVIGGMILSTVLTLLVVPCFLEMWTREKEKTPQN